MQTPFENESAFTQRKLQQSNLEQKVQRLREKLIGFSVINQRQQILGNVKDLRLDSHYQPNLIITQIGDGSEQIIEFNDRSISHVDSKARVILMQEATYPPCDADDPVLSPELDHQVSSELDGFGASEQVELNQPTLEVKETLTIPLLEEHLKVNYRRNKIGEVIVRKVIETRMVEVPVRYERLIVEQVAPEFKQIADVRLDDATFFDAQPATGSLCQPVVRGEFTSLQVASQVLYAIAQNLNTPCRRVSVEIELEDDRFIDLCQQWMNQERVKKEG